MENKTLLKSKFQGALLGLAVGDALGAPIEFLERDTYPEITKMIAGGPFNLGVGQWTDDTSLALCMAASLIEQQQFNAEDIIKRFHQWFRHGYMSCTGHCFDIGNTTKAALLRYEEKGELFAGSPDDPATNGSIMRLAPVVLFYHQDLEKILFYAGESSRITHAPIECIDACKALAYLIERALKSESSDQLSKEKLLEFHPEDLNLTPSISKVLLGSYKKKSREQISAKGNAVTCLEAALWSFYNSHDFNSGILQAVNLGEDSDTTGAVYGQLAGAFYGVDSIRSDFLESLFDKKLLLNCIDQLFIFNQNPFYKLGENLTVDIIVMNPKKEILVIRRSSESEACPSMLAFPGGFVDEGELPMAAAIRELHEETNLKLSSELVLELVGEYVGNHRDPRDNQFSWSKTCAYFYQIDSKTFEEQLFNIRGLDDADEAFWICCNELVKAQMAFDHNKILKDVISKCKI